MGHNPPDFPLAARAERLHLHIILLLQHQRRRLGLPLARLPLAGRLLRLGLARLAELLGLLLLKLLQDAVQIVLLTFEFLPSDRY